jgi:dinuclear metal center YbgI/SA1388 family protein
MRLAEFDRLIRELLRLEEAGAGDSALNGLQVANSREEVGRVAFAVDACLEAIRRAAEWKADLLFVHHGLLRVEAAPLTGWLYRRLHELLTADCALYAVHLPLDVHPELGNNAVLARRLGLQDLQPFGLHRGRKIGCKGTLPQARSLEELAALCCGERRSLSLLAFGPEAIRTVGIISGGGAGEALQAIDEGLDLFITGEPSHMVYHPCLEGRLNVIFGGHYLTEIWGVKGLAERLAEEHGLATVFLDIPTGL